MFLENEYMHMYVELSSVHLKQFTDITFYSKMISVDSDISSSSKKNMKLQKS